MRPVIYLFGDSITEGSFCDGGWGASLAHHFSRTADVVLRGYSGYNTRWALKVIERVFPEVDRGGGAPLAVTVFFGANDASLPDRCSAFQHVPIHEYKQNLHSIVSFLKGNSRRVIILGAFPGYEEVMMRSKPNETGLRHPLWFSDSVGSGNFINLPMQKRWPTALVLLITPPPIDEEGRLRNPYVENPLGLPERTNRAAGAYAEACIAVAGECGSPVVDIWTKMQRISDWQKICLSDGLHLTQSGNRTVFEEVVAKLREEGVGLETLPIDLPHIVEIDPNDPLKSFT